MTERITGHGLAFRDHSTWSLPRRTSMWLRNWLKLVVTSDFSSFPSDDRAVSLLPLPFLPLWQDLTTKVRRLTKTDVWAHECSLLKEQARCHVSSFRPSLYQITGFSGNKNCFTFMGCKFIFQVNKCCYDRLSFNTKVLGFKKRLLVHLC